MRWNFLLTATANGTIKGSSPFRNAPIRVEMTQCRMAPNANTARSLAVFSGEGLLLVGEQRFAFDPNRYGLLLERDELTYGDWLTVAFGTADSPLILAGFGLPRNGGLLDGQELQSELDAGLNCQATLEALDGDTLEMALIQLERGTSTPRLSVQRHA